MATPDVNQQPATLPAALTLEGVRYQHRGGAWQLAVPALRVEAGERVFLHGPSGSGKSTLLALIAGTLACRAGEISIAGHTMSATSARRRDRLRADAIGVIFQQFNLLPFLGLAANVALPCRFSTRRRQRACARYGSVEAAAWALLGRLGLARDEFATRAVVKLSVGQQQRVAVARALIGAPDLLLADEPTSALDPRTREQFLQLVLSECQRDQIGLLLVSHDHALQAHFDRALSLPSGAGA